MQRHMSTRLLKKATTKPRFTFNVLHGDVLLTGSDDCLPHKAQNYTSYCWQRQHVSWFSGSVYGGHWQNCLLWVRKWWWFPSGAFHLHGIRVSRCLFENILAGYQVKTTKIYNWLGNGCLFLFVCINIMWKIMFSCGCLSKPVSHLTLSGHINFIWCYIAGISIIGEFWDQLQNAQSWG